MMKTQLTITCIVVAAFSCDQTNKETTVAGKETVKSSETEVPKATQEEERCLVPTPETAPVLVENKGECPSDPVFGGLTMERAAVTLIDAPNQPALDVELAKTDEERMRGLMYRTSMPENAGMLFFPNGEPKKQSFWMRNTCIPLDMMFITEDGFIAGILENVPILNDEPRSVECLTSYVLEVNAGWSRAHGVKAGQKVKLP